MKISIVVPVYYNQDNLIPLYEDIKDKLFTHSEYEWELVMVNDGSKDDSWDVMKELASKDDRIKIFSLSRNFGSHAAILCGLSKCTGDCAAIKAADLQEPTEIVLPMIELWKQGNNVVLATRKERPEGIISKGFSNLYYKLVQKVALPQMPKGGFDAFLIDRKVVQLLDLLDEKNSAITGQILWSGFKTATVDYERQERKIGKSKWTLKKKVRLVMDTIFSFSALPIKIVWFIGLISFVGALVWAVFEIVMKAIGKIEIAGWTTLFVFNLFSFGIIMITLGILGEYLWRTFDSARNRPPYIIEDSDEQRKDK